ncbi:MAG: universal stress protein [Desulfatitalea sp.]|nr:universal stress protein [Desulfatitalea sp.]NNK00068.1 universal stress protein [Desulfatitalea sp.]
MHKKILIATDGSIHSQNAIGYAADAFQAAEDVQFCLLNIQPLISQYLLEASRTNGEAYDTLQKAISHNAAKSEKMLSRDRMILVRQGIDERRVQTVSRPRMFGQAKDILLYAHRHWFDTLVVGRRGLTRVQKVFMGSTSAKLMEHAAVLPICIVDSDATLNRMLVALDASEDTMAIVDYLAMMLAHHPRVRVTVCHVRLDHSEVSGYPNGIGPSLAKLIARSEEKWHSQFWPNARQRLNSAGIGDDRIELIDLPRKGRIAKMILNEAETGHYDTVVLGRSGTGKAFYFGRVARYVCERLTDKALWLIG